MDARALARKVRNIPDFPKPGILFYDITTLLKDPVAFRAVVDQMAEQVAGTQVDFDTVKARGSAFGKDNVIAEHAIVSGDLRALSLEQFAKARRAMEAIVATSLAGTSAQITFDEGYPPLAPTEGNQRLLAMYDQASRDVGAGPVTAVDPDRAGAADVSFVAGHVPLIIDGIGLMGHTDHTVNETADLDTLPSQTKRAAVFLHRLHRSLK